jgi:hypothetical protein
VNGVLSRATGLRLPGSGLKQLGSLLAKARYEVFPTASAEAAVLEAILRAIVGCVGYLATI